jgi:2-polyprenyl-6-methoxyphenol hydroxylase-like FAD-dependent oxidoreductase
VCIIGGGPTGLASAISLAEKGQGKVEVHVWERRWVVTETGTIDYPPTARRRDQVVTLQDSVTTLLSARSFEALFEGHPERVWPGSANIQIRKVEDRLLSRCQTDEFHGLIHLHAEGVTREELAAGKCGDFHVLLGTDGAASWVRQNYFRGYEKERGKSYALGLAFDRGAKGGLPWSQPLNMFLTLGQTRYLLNASDHDGKGYLNMQLTEEEWEKMVGVDGKPIHFGNPACLRLADGSIPEGFDASRVFAPSEDRNSPLWKSIEDGLKLFGFKESEVINVVRIPIVVQAVREGVQPLPLEDSRYVARPHALVAVAGDAAMTVHFWPGRGLNSGIKAGIALGDEICHALMGGKFAGLQLSAMKEYNDFIMKLQGREHDKRSIPILNQSGSPEMLGWLLKRAQAVPEEVAVEW